MVGSKEYGSVSDVGRSRSVWALSLRIPNASCWSTFLREDRKGNGKDRVSYRIFSLGGGEMLCVG